MAVDANAIRRQRAWDSIPDGASRTWSRRVRGSDYSLTLSNPSIRTLNERLVFSVDVRVTKDGVLFFDDKLNMPNPPVATRGINGTITDNPRQALRDTVVDVLRACTNDLTTPHIMRDADGNLLGDTLAVRSTAADGYVESDGTTSWNTVRNGNSLRTETADTVSLLEASNVGPGTEYQLRQMFFDFDTSSIGSSSTVTNGVFTLYGNAGATPEVNTDGYDMQIRPFNWGGTLSTADWIDVNPSSGWTDLTLMAHKAVSTWDQGSGAANAFTVDSYADVSKTSTTYVVLGMSALGAASGPTGTNTVPVRMADASGTSTDPLLTVTYTVNPSGTIAATLRKALFSGSGTQTQTGTIAATLQKATAALSGGQTYTGSAAATMQAATFSGSGAQAAGAEGTIAATMQAATASFTGAMQPSGTIASTLQYPTFAATGAQVYTGTIAATMQAATMAATGTQTQTGTIAGTLQPALFSGAGAQIYTGTIAATLQEPTAALVGVMQPSGVIAVTMRKATFAGAGTHQQIGAIAAALQAATFSGAGAQIQTGTIAGTLRYLTFEGLGVLAMPGFAIVLDSYADGIRLLDQFADGVTLSDARADGITLFDLGADGITVNDNYSNGARLYDGRQ